MSVKLSFIIPVYNESSQIKQCLINLQTLRQDGHEVIVVDGGSDDDTLSLAQPICDVVITSKKSRAIQMNAGASKANGEYLLFLHVDTVIPENTNQLFSALEKNNWGRFDVSLSGKHFMFRVIETCMNIRSRLSGIATGDQVMFVDRELFSKIGGFPELALMEDIAISKQLLQFSKPICFSDKVVSSSRRWEKNGIIKTILKMWYLRLLYFFDVDTNKLAKMYY
jgi:rSAM/selenodomain-associated transferase 2